MSTPGYAVNRCECDWKYHQGKPCPTAAEDHWDLCTQCLFVCCGEREDEEDQR